MEEELAQLEVSDAEKLSAEIAEDDLIAGKKKGDDEDGIIAILQG